MFTIFYLSKLVESSTLLYDKLDDCRAGVAQSVEQRFCKPQVGGSIPLASSISFTHSFLFGRFLCFHRGLAIGLLIDRNFLRGLMHGLCDNFPIIAGSVAELDVHSTLSKSTPCGCQPENSTTSDIIDYRVPETIGNVFSQPNRISRRMNSILGRTPYTTP